MLLHNYAELLRSILPSGGLSRQDYREQMKGAGGTQGGSGGGGHDKEEAAGEGSRGGGMTIKSRLTAQEEWHAGRAKTLFERV